ncbi:MAG TPA: hypothetical protein VMS54_13120 [Vicinamibacterales bacterium]|nr:hypothetical protein [Vicinamibacterales bacterium]
MKAMVLALVMVAVAGLTAGHRHAPVAPPAGVPLETRVLTGPIPVAVPTFAPAGVEVLLLVR